MGKYKSFRMVFEPRRSGDTETEVTVYMFPNRQAIWLKGAPNRKPSEILRALLGNPTFRRFYNKNYGATRFISKARQKPLTEGKYQVYLRGLRSIKKPFAWGTVQDLQEDLLWTVERDGRVKSMGAQIMFIYVTHIKTLLGMYSIQIEDAKTMQQRARVEYIPK